MTKIDAELEEFFQHAADEMISAMEKSAFAIVINEGKADPKFCMEVGAAILLDKPLIVFLMPEVQISATLARIAFRVVQGDVRDPEAKLRLEQAITDLVNYEKQNGSQRPGGKK